MEKSSPEFRQIFVDGYIDGKFGMMDLVFESVIFLSLCVYLYLYQHLVIGTWGYIFGILVSKTPIALKDGLSSISQL